MAPTALVWAFVCAYVVPPGRQTTGASPLSIIRALVFLLISERPLSAYTSEILSIALSCNGVYKDKIFVYANMKFRNRFPF